MNNNHGEVDRARGYRTTRLISRLVVLLMLSQMCGCAMPWLSKKNDVPYSLAKAETPKKMVALWSDTTYHTAGKPPTRGLAGRIYFYDERHRPIPVHGKLVVYGYDDSRDAPSNRAPDQKFEFTADEFPHHFEKSDFGDSYSVWLPWDVMGGKRKDVSVIPVFTSVDGKVVMGRHSRHALPGRGEANSVPGRLQSTATPTGTTEMFQRTSGSQQASGFKSQVQTASFTGPNELSQQAAAHQAATPEKLRASSIPLPPSVSRRLANSVPLQQQYISSQPIRATSRATGARDVNSQNTALPGRAVQNRTLSSYYNVTPTRPSAPDQPQAMPVKTDSIPAAAARSQSLSLPFLPRQRSLARYEQMKRRVQDALNAPLASDHPPMQPYRGGSPSGPASQSPHQAAPY